MKPIRLVTALSASVALGSVVAPAWSQADASACQPVIEALSRREGDAVRVDVTLRVGVPVELAWEVMTDYKHAARFIGQLKSSQSELLGPHQQKVTQLGWIGWGSVGVTIQTIYQVDLDREHWQVTGELLSGDVKNMKMLARLHPESASRTLLEYQVTTDPGQWIPGFVAERLLRQQARDSFGDLAAEMLRRGSVCDKNVSSAAGATS